MSCVGEHFCYAIAAQDYLLTRTRLDISISDAPLLSNFFVAQAHTCCCSCIRDRLSHHKVLVAL